MPTPFQYLKQNIYRIKFDCDPKYIPEYKRTFAAVLDRVDKYFIDNKLYDCGDYQSYVEDMIKYGSKFSFRIDEEIKKRGWDGVHSRKSDGSRSIGIIPEEIGRGLEAEGTLCHEFLHYLTLGPDKLKYKKNGKNVEVEFSLYKGQSKESVWEQGNTSSTPDFSFRKLSVEAVNYGFMCEAMTELTKQKIYSLEESYGSYKPLTEMMDFVSRMVGVEISTREFLQGNLQTFSYAMSNAFHTFYNDCETFFEKYTQNANIDYKRDKSYIAIQDTFVRSYLTSIEMELRSSKYKPSKVAEILSTLYSAPVPNRQYDAKISSLKTNLAVRQKLPTEQCKKFRQTLNKTISEMALHDTKTFALPENAPNVILKQTKAGLAISYNGSPDILASELPSNTNNTIVLQRRDGQDFIHTILKLTEQGFYEISSKNLTTCKVQTINLMFDAKNPNSVLISDKENGTKYQLPFADIQKRREKNIEENKTLLDNFQHFAAIQDMISAMPAKRYCDIKKIISNGGQEYLVATSKDKTMFVKVEDKEYKLVDIKAKSKLPETQVCDKIYTGKNKTGMIGYMPTKSSTDEDNSIVYSLADGTTFVSYWNDGKLFYGEKIYPFANTTDTRIVTTKNDTLYSTSNESLDSVFEKPAATSTTDTSYSSRVIKRELPTRDLDAERKAREEQQRKQAETQRRQQEIERRREEERRHKEIRDEEIARRNKKLEEERRHRAQKAEAQQQNYSDLQEHISKRQRIYDEFDVDITDIVNRQQNQRQNVSYGRSR